MSKLKVSPTKTNLLKVKESLIIAEQGYGLLKEKKDVLVNELMKMLQEYKEIQEETAGQLKHAYRNLEFAIISNGILEVHWIAEGITDEVEINIRDRSVMGVPLPIIDYKSIDIELNYGFKHTVSALDEAIGQLADILQTLCHLAEIQTAIYQIVREIKKTQRRVNALSNVFIPSYDQTVKFIEETLEEGERESLFRVKMVKRKLR